MARLYVVCVSKPVQSIHQRISFLGVDNGERLTPEEMARRIMSGQDQFYVRSGLIDVEVRPMGVHTLHPWVQAHPNGLPGDNLLDLPPCLSYGYR